MHHGNNHAVRFPVAHSHAALIASPSAATVTVEVYRALHIHGAVSATCSAANMLLLLLIRCWFNAADAPRVRY